MKTRQTSNSSRDGAILAVVMVMLIVLSILILGLFQLGFHSARETEHELRRAQAFWLAEAGRHASMADLYAGRDGNRGILAATSFGDGTYQVVEDPVESRRRISTGTVTVGNRTVTRRILFDLAFVSPLFEKVVYAGNKDYPDDNWSLQISGMRDLTTVSGGPPRPTSSSGNFPGGRDSLLGDVEVKGDVWMDGQSRVGVPDPNRYGVAGDVDASGTIYQGADATIAGSRRAGSTIAEPPNLAEMDYAANNSYDIAQIFSDAGVSSGSLPVGHPLRNVVVKNPSNRKAENDSTAGDDYYFEPASISGAGTPSTAVTRLVLGDDKVYYVDGHAWFHSKSTYGFQVDGQATIVASRDIHISDNLAYQNRGLEPVGDNPPDMLALVALGQYTGEVRSSHGDIYFGDPEYGTMYTVDAFMFANNDFYYNTDANTGAQGEPNSGFKVFGNYMAVNRIVIQRDWYTRNTYNSGGVERVAYRRDNRWYDAETDQRLYNTSVTSQNLAAEYDPVSEQWRDTLTGTELHSSQVASLRHYAMEVGYDDRIRDAATQMPGLPRGYGSIFAGRISWQEIPPLP